MPVILHPTFTHFIGTDGPWPQAISEFSTSAQWQPWPWHQRGKQKSRKKVCALWSPIKFQKCIYLFHLFLPLCTVEPPMVLNYTGEIQKLILSWEPKCPEIHACPQWQLNYSLSDYTTKWLSPDMCSPPYSLSLEYRQWSSCSWRCTAHRKHPVPKDMYSEVPCNATI